jgi:hypothetical protein
MQTYSERSTQLAVDASVAVLVLLGTAPDDMEFIPLKPKMATEESMLMAELRARWPGRGLRSVGVIGLCGTSPRCAFKEPLETQQISALAAAFLVYLDVLFRESFAAQTEKAELSELERLFNLPDPRAN